MILFSNSDKAHKKALHNPFSVDDFFLHPSLIKDKSARNVHFEGGLLCYRAYEEVCRKEF
jgi:hypothetical protein